MVVPRRVGAPGFGVSVPGSGGHGGGSGRGGAAAVRGDAMAAACCSGAEEVAAMVKARVGSGWLAMARPRLALVAGVGWPEATPAWPDAGPPRPDLASAMPVPSPGVVAAAAQALPAGGLRRERFWAMSTAVVKVNGSTCAVVSRSRRRWRLGRR